MFPRLLRVHAVHILYKSYISTKKVRVVDIDDILYVDGKSLFAQFTHLTLRQFPASVLPVA